MAIRLGRTERPAAISGAHAVARSGGPPLQFRPAPASVRAAPAYVLIERRTLAIPATRIGAGGMPRLREIRWGNRFVPCPDGFRRRQFYSWEALDRFCGMGFETIAGHRPEMRITAAPVAVAHIDVARLWTAPLRGPGHGRARTPPPGAAVSGALSACPVRSVRCRAGDLSLASPGQARIRTLDSRHHFPTAAILGFVYRLCPGAPPGRPLPDSARAMGQRHGGSLRHSRLGAPADARFETHRLPRGHRRAASRSSRDLNSWPAIAGPGRRPQNGFRRRLFEPAAAKLRSESVAPGARRPAAGSCGARSRPGTEHDSGERLPGAGRAHSGEQHRASGLCHPAGAGAAFRSHARRRGGRPAHPSAGTAAAATSFDIAKGSPQLLERESLQRFRRRGYEAMRSRQTSPRWPAPSVPGLAALAANLPCAHPSRQPSSETAASHVPRARSAGRRRFPPVLHGHGLAASRSRDARLRRLGPGAARRRDRDAARADAARRLAGTDPRLGPGAAARNRRSRPSRFTRISAPAWPTGSAPMPTGGRTSPASGPVRWRCCGLRST